MGQISRLMVGLAVLAGTALGAPAQAQIEAPANFKTDTDPKLQGRTSILEAFDVDTSKLPKGSVINRVRAKDGSIDELRLTVPARITVNWQAPTRQSKTCDIKLTMVRTGARPGAQLPACLFVRRHQPLGWRFLDADPQWQNLGKQSSGMA